MKLDELLSTHDPRPEVDVDTAWARVVGAGRARRARRKALGATASVLLLAFIGGVVTSAVSRSNGDDVGIVADQAPDLQPAAGTVDAGSWSGVRTGTDAAELVIAFSGGSPDPDHPCHIAYRAAAEETGNLVIVEIKGIPSTPPLHEAGSCKGTDRVQTVTVDLGQPLGDRAVSRAGSPDQWPVFDGSTLADPGWLPSGWTLINEGGFVRQHDSDVPEDAGVFGWNRTWGPPNAEGPRPQECGAQARRFLSVMQVPTSADPNTFGSIGRTEITIRNRRAMFSVADRVAIVEWIEDGQRIHVALDPICDDSAVPPDLRLFAEELEVANPN